MGLTSEDRRWTKDTLRSEFAASEERVYKRIEDGALSDLRKDVVSITERIDGMAEDVAKIPVIEGEIRAMNMSLKAIRDHFDI